ncbi:hypothetical protein AMS68_007638 [Peltaster fructicola]|uniref:Protein kinase domain-containing protein n=1 Tax=Peltaster fructicola TaxID=286661 RepID=A0A6H0Y5B9_9PEZI|nr:hypothetical protein AMS68_007638 [Peltaster fructicola]
MSTRRSHSQSRCTTSSETAFFARLDEIRKRNKLYRLETDDPPSKDDYFVTKTDIKDNLLEKSFIAELLTVGSPSQKEKRRQRDIISESYSIVFAILVYIGAGDCIERFIEHGIKDDTLPLREKPEALPHEKQWQAFDNVQWRFKPQRLDSETRHVYHPKAIIPYIAKSRVPDGSGTTGTLYEVTLHREYDGLFSQRYKANAKSSVSGSHKRYAIKVYHGRTAETCYNNETRIFGLIKGHKDADYPDGIIEYLGAYRRTTGGPYCLILELATGRTLSYMFEHHDPPTAAEDIHKFWTLFLELLRGLTKLHGLARYTEGGTWKVSQWYVTSCSTEPSVADTEEYVLIDLGHASTVEVVNGSTLPGVLDTKAGLEYAAPEACPATDDDFHSSRLVDYKVDIFALGLVMLDALVWVVRGKDLYKRFTEARRLESERTRTKKSGFHTSESEETMFLEIVDKHIHGYDIRQNIDPSDTTTLRVHECLMARMTRIKPSERPPANMLLLDYDDLVTHSRREQVRRSQQMPNVEVVVRVADEGSASDDSRKDDRDADQEPSQSAAAGPSSNGLPLREMRVEANGYGVYPVRPSQDWLRTNTPLSPQHHIGQDLVSSGHYATHSHVTVDEVLEYKGRRQRYKKPTGWLDPEPTLRYMHKRKILEKRDFIFLYDDSSSMDASHEVSARRTFDAMSCVLDPLDKDGIELYFASDMLVHREKASKLCDIIADHRHRGVTDMAVCLNGLLDTCTSRLFKEKSRVRDWMRLWRPKGISIYILTDGNWDLDGVRTTIHDCVKRLEAHKMDRRELCISFIAFGDDEQCHRRMQELDDMRIGGKKVTDIVDSEHYTGNFWKMILGSRDADEDADPQVPPPLKR